MGFSSHADEEYITRLHPVIPDTSGGSSGSPATRIDPPFRRDKIKTKLRNGVSIRAPGRFALYKSLILATGDENETISPIIDAENEHLDGTELENYLLSCSVFDRNLMKFPWLNHRGHIIRNLILQDLAL